MTCGHFPHVLGWVILLTPFGLFDFSAAENGSHYANLRAASKVMNMDIMIAGSNFARVTLSLVKVNSVIGDDIRLWSGLKCTT